MRREWTLEHGLWVGEKESELRKEIYEGLSFHLRPWSCWWTANSDKKYMELNGAALNENKPCVTSPKTAFPKDK